MTAKKTAYLSLPLPNAGNALAEDCPRLAEALTKTDAWTQKTDTRVTSAEQDIDALQSVQAAHTDQIASLQSDLSSYLPRVGGIVTGSLEVEGDLRHAPAISTVTLSDALTAGTSIEVPEHTVGGAGMVVYLCGIRCERGAEAQYLDVDSTHISFNDDLDAGMDIAAIVIFK